jgi:hypothetical protein
MSGELFFSKSLLVVWKCLETDEELAVFDMPKTPFVVLSEPFIDPVQPVNDESDHDDFRLVKCLTPAGVGWVGIGHLQ